MQPWQSREIRQTVERFRKRAEDYFGEGGMAAKADFRQKWQKCADLGLLSLIPGEGLRGAELPAMVAAYEGFGQGGADGGLLFALAAQLLSVQTAVRSSGSRAMQEEELQAMMSGRMIAAHAITEEGAGSDVFSMSTTARRAKEHYQLNGSKSYITAALEADVALILARTSEEDGPFSLSAFLVRLDSKGIERSAGAEKLGLRDVSMGELTFREVKVPVQCRLGPEGAGFSILTESTTWERALLPMTLLGPMQHSVDYCIQWSVGRVQFGQSIAGFQQVSARIADMLARTQICRQILYDLAAQLQSRKSVASLAQQAAIAKLFVSESAIQVQRDALQILGARGYLSHSPVARHLSDALAGTLWSGTSETLRNTIARLAGLPASV